MYKACYSLTLSAQSVIFMSMSVQEVTKSLDVHLTSKVCNDCQTALEELKKKKTLLTFFGPQEASKENTPGVRSPTPVHADPVEPVLMPGLSLLPPQKYRMNMLQHHWLTMTCP